MTEADLLSRVVDLAKLRGWLVSHSRPAKTDKGWRTPLLGDRGAPDLLLCRAGVVLLAELKSDVGRLGPGQEDWLREAGSHARLWRPDSWTDICRELR